MRKRFEASVSCFGEVLWDVFELDRPERKSGARFVREIGGAPANVATVLARLGIDVSMVGAVGDDRFGHDLRAALAEEGVGVEHLLALPNRTGLAFVRRDPAGEPSFLFYRHDTADVAIEARHVVPAMARARFGFVGTSTLLTPALRRATHAYARHLRAAGGTFFVDLNVRAHMWKDHDAMRTHVAALVAKASIVKASGADLEAIAGSISRGTSWLSRHAPRAVQLHTRGAGDAFVRGPFGTVVVPVPNAGARCVDATGAGDAFIAGVLARLVRSSAFPGTPLFHDRGLWHEALTLGHRLGEKAISKPGAVKGVVALAGIRRTLERR